MLKIARPTRRSKGSQFWNGSTPAPGNSFAAIPTRNPETLVPGFLLEFLGLRSPDCLAWNRVTFRPARKGDRSCAHGLPAMRGSSLPEASCDDGPDWRASGIQNKGRLR